MNRIDIENSKPELQLFSRGALGLGVLAGVCFAVSRLLVYIRWVGNLESIAAWTPLVVVTWALFCVDLRLKRAGLQRLRGGSTILLVGPLFAFGRGRLDVIGALLYFVPLALAYVKVLPALDAAVASSPEHQAIIAALAKSERAPGEEPDRS